MEFIFPYPTFCYPYGHTWDREWNILDLEIGAVGILVCVVARGNSYGCTWKEAVGDGLKEGLDSHESDSGEMSGFFLMQSGTCPYVYSGLKGTNIIVERSCGLFMSGNHGPDFSTGCGHEVERRDSCFERSGKPRI
jgi:hypothetical protein